MKHPLSLYRCLFFVLALILPLQLCAQAQKKDNQGKEFYVAFAENQGGQVGSDETENFMALWITSQLPAHGTVEVKALGFSQNFTTTPGTITTIELPDGKSFGDPTVECKTSEQVLAGMAVHITADNDVAIYGMNHKRWSSDAFMALPIGVLGTEYRTLNYQTSLYGGETPGEFWIAGVVDSTNITITPKAQTYNGIPAGTQIKALLYKGDVFLVKGDPNDGTNDLTGSLIVSDQPIAVFSGHVRTEILNGFKNKGSQYGSRDHLNEQLPPVSTWGDSAIVVQYSSASLPDLVRIVSSEDNNTVKVNGIVKATLNAGEFYEISAIPITTPAISIQATSPILVGQYMHTSVYGIGNPDGKPYGDPAYSLCSPVEQFDTTYTFMLDENPTAFDANFVNVVADPAGVGTMMLDGNPVTGPPYNAKFQAIPGSNYVYAQIKLPQGEHNIYSTKTFGITAYAFGPVDSYSYPGGSLLKTITPFKTVDVVIDFGDRVMTGPVGGPYTPGAIGINRWDTTVYLQNISSDPYTIVGWAEQGGNAPVNTFNVTSPPSPSTIGAGIIDSFTIEFTPGFPGTRFHTTIKAQTEHLRAYVVDVFGRGILPNVEIYGDSVASYHIDTLDFGILDAATQPLKDSFVFLFDKGTADLLVQSQSIAGPNMPDFSIPFPDTLKSIAGNPPFTLHPYNILGLTTLGAKVPLRFTASGLPNGFYQAEYDVVAQGQLHKVILLATVKTILKSTVTPAVFDTVFLCQNQTRSIFIDNPNDFAVTVTNLIIGGPDKADFSVITAVPLVIAPNSRGEIQLSFAPSAVTGSRNATVTVTLDLPKGFTQTFPLSAYADQLSSSFWARNNIHILPGEETVFPIYARSPMELFSSSSFELDVWYDPTNIEDEPDKLIQDNTLTLQDAYYLVLGDTAGYRQYFCETTDGSILTGGSDTTQMPLVYLTFKSHYNPGDVPAHFHQDVDINYKVTFDHSPFLSGCILSLAPAGRITLDSTCETVYLLQDTFLYPQGSFIVPIHPNPVSTFATFEFDVPELARTLQLTPNSSDPKVIDTKIPVRLDIIDMLGNIAAVVTDEMKKPGTYQIQWDARGVKPGAYLVRLITAGTVKTRQIVIVR